MEIYVHRNILKKYGIHTMDKRVMLDKDICGNKKNTDFIHHIEDVVLRGGRGCKKENTIGYHVDDYIFIMSEDEIYIKFRDHVIKINGCSYHLMFETNLKRFISKKYNKIRSYGYTRKFNEINEAYRFIKSDKKNNDIVKKIEKFIEEQKPALNKLYFVSKYIRIKILKNTKSIFVDHTYLSYAVRKLYNIVNQLENLNHHDEIRYSLDAEKEEFDDIANYAGDLRCKLMYGKY